MYVYKYVYMYVCASAPVGPRGVEEENDVAIEMNHQPASTVVCSNGCRYQCDLQLIDKANIPSCKLRRHTVTLENSFIVKYVLN
jgi:hypothetical protein